MSISGNFIHRHHVEPRVKLHVPREESFPGPLKYIDVTRTTHTSPDVLLGNIDDYWKVDVGRELSEAWRSAAVLKKVWPSCGSSIGQPAYFGVPFDRGGTIAAAIARKTTQLGTSQSVILFKIDDGLAMRTQLPTCPNLHQPPRNSQPVSPGPLPNCPIRDVVVAE